MCPAGADSPALSRPSSPPSGLPERQSMTEKIIKYYWEDMPAGSVRDLGSITPTAEEIIAFATQFDPQPFHLDAEAAKDSVFGGLCASGWHTCAMAMRLMVTNFLCEASSQGSPGLEAHQVAQAGVPRRHPAPATHRGRVAPHEQTPRRGPGAHQVGHGQPARRAGAAHGGLGHVPATEFWRYPVQSWLTALPPCALWPDNAAWTSNP